MEFSVASVATWFFLLEIVLAIDSGDIFSFHFTEDARDGRQQPYDFGRRSFNRVLEPTEPKSYWRHPNRATHNRRNSLNLHNIDDGPKSDFVQSDYGHFQSENQVPDDDFRDETSSIAPDQNRYLYPTLPVGFYTQTHQQQALQSPWAIPDSENFGSFQLLSDLDPNKRPQFWTKAQNRPFKDGESDSEESATITRPHYHLQKISLPERRFSSTTPTHGFEDSDANRYEEVELTHDTPVVKEPAKDTRKQMRDMMKNYLAKLLVEQYGRRLIKGRVERTNKTNAPAVMNNKHKSTGEKFPKLGQESKFLYSDALSMLKNKTLTKIKQFFSIFTVVKFNNVECNTTNWAGTWQGTCLTSSGCSKAAGIDVGTCSRGFGVCCVFRGTCGDSSHSNGSYFKSPNYPDYYPPNGGVVTPTTTAFPAFPPTPDPRLHWSNQYAARGIQLERQSSSDSTSCVFMVNKVNADVQQLRIDFVDLDLAGPTNGTCTDERLIISGQNSNDQIPVICGYNTGQHVYVDVSELSGPFTIMVLSATGARKRFKMKISQYTDTCQTSQSNCLQYYTGTSGVVQSFNYDRAAMFSRSTPGYFNNLNYAVCIRREAGYCSITYSSVRNGQMYPFQLVNSQPNGQSTVPAGQAGVGVLNCPDDFVIIDGTRLCGDRFNDGSTVINFSQNAPVVDTSSGPIVIHVRTNSNVTGLGFKLNFMQNRCPSN